MKLIGCLILSAAFALAQSPAELQLKAATHKQEVEGDLKGAMEAYRQIIAKSGKERGVVAQAMLRLAQCHEKLGQAEARKLYEQIASGYADQAAVASQARQRLSAMGAQTQSALSTRQVWSGTDVDSEASITPDGKLMTFIHWSTGDIATRDMASGRIDRMMAKTGSWEQSNEYAEWPLLSPDQKQLVYAWFEPKVDRYQFRSMPNQRGAKARTLVDGPQFDYFEPAGWSPDGKSVLSTIWRDDNTVQIGWISAETGKIRTLKSLEWRNPRASLSPDGKYVAYAALSGNDSTNRHLYLLAADGGAEAVLDDGPGTKESPIWSPDGNHVVYISDRAGSNGFWAVRVKDGKALGAPQLVHRNTGNAIPRGFTRAGTLFYFQQDTAPNTFSVATVDQVSATIRGDSVPIRRGSIRLPSWSPDGKLVAFVARRSDTARGPGSHNIIVRDVNTGVERLYPLAQNQTGRPLWSPDQAMLYTLTRDRQGRNPLLRLELSSGKWAEVLALDKVNNYLDSALSPDGRTWYTVEFPAKRPVIASYDLSSGRREEFYKFDEGISQARVTTVSRDGASLGVLVISGPGKRAIGIVGPTGFHRLLDVPNQGGWSDWSPDGQWMYFTRREEQNVRLMRVSVQGGEPQYAGLTLGGMGIFQFDREGTKILYAGGEARGVPEYWALDNLNAVLNRSK